MIYQLKITLKHTKPTIWRRIQIDSQMSFFVLHQLIQEAFDWDGGHLHEFSLKSNDQNPLALFDTGQTIIGSVRNPEDYHIGSMLDEVEETIEAHLKKEKDKALYIYDFGDDWQHEIILENILYPEKIETYPRCIKAKGIAPEEDSRGMLDGEEVWELEIDDKTLVEEINKSFEAYLTQPEEDPEIIAEQENWQSLFHAVDEFKNLKPWQQFWDSQIIVVRIPEIEETAYCSILGNGGEEFGLAVYLGDEGLLSLRKIVESPEQAMDGVIEQRSLLISLSDRNELEKEDYSLIKSLDLRFRGKKQWPMFRSFKPGYYPWFLDQDEGRLLKDVLEQVIAVGEKYKHTPELIPEYSDNQWFAWLPSEEGQTVHWEESMITPEIKETEMRETEMHVSEMDVKRLKKRLRRFNGTIEFDAHYFPEPVQENEQERPFFPRMILAAEQKNGTMLYSEMLGNEQYEENLQSTFFHMMEQIEGIPQEVRVENKQTLQILQPLFKVFAIQAMKVSELPVISSFRKELEGKGGMF